MGNIKVGQKVRFSVDAFPTAASRGRVKANPPQRHQSAERRHLRCRCRGGQPRADPAPGMTAHVNIGVARRQDVLLVPNAALRFAGRCRGGQRHKGGGKSAGANGGRRGGKPGWRYGRRQGPGKKRDTASGTVLSCSPGRNCRSASSSASPTTAAPEVVGGDLKPGDRVVTGDNVAVKAPSSVGMRDVLMVPEAADAVIRVVGLGKSRDRRRPVSRALKGGRSHHPAGSSSPSWGLPAPANPPS